MTTAPCDAASLTAVGMAVDDESPATSGPRERLRTRAPCSVAHLMPAATSSGCPTQLPDFASYVRTRTGRIRAFGATPNEDDATVPATCVPWSHWSGLAGPGWQVPPTQSAPARTRPSKSRCDASTHESRTATVTPAPERPAGRALGTCTWSKFQVRCGAVPAAYAGTTQAMRASATRAP